MVCALGWCKITVLTGFQHPTGRRAQFNSSSFQIYFTNLFTDEYSMWKYVPTMVLPAHEITNLLVMFVVYPAAVLVYLTHFPLYVSKKTKMIYILF